MFIIYGDTLKCHTTWWYYIYPINFYEQLYLVPNYDYKYYYLISKYGLYKGIIIKDNPIINSGYYIHAKMHNNEGDYQVFNPYGYYIVSKRRY